MHCLSLVFVCTTMSAEVGIRHDPDGVRRSVMVGTGLECFNLLFQIIVLGLKNEDPCKEQKGYHAKRRNRHHDI